MTDTQNILVLIVDDEPLIRFIAGDALEEAGFQVVEAANAEEAMSVLKSHDNVGILFTDVNMPGPLNGLELAELVNRRWPTIKLVITSGRALERAVPDTGRFLAKPYDLGLMADLIAEVNDGPAKRA